MKNLWIKNKKFIIDLLWRSIQIFSKNGIGFLIFLIASNILAPSDFGTYNYILALILLISSFSDFGISNATSKYVTEYLVTDPEKLKRVLFNTSLIIISLSSLIILGLITAGPKVFGDNFQYLLYTTPLLILIPLTSLYDGFYRGLSKFKFVSIVSLISGIISVIFIVVLSNKLQLIGALVSQNIYYALLLIFLMFGYKGSNFKLDKSLIKEIGKYSFIIGIGSLGYLLYSRVDVLFLGRYNFVTEIGYYEIASKILWIILLPFQIIGQVLAPKITRKYINAEISGITAYLKNYLKITSVLSILTLLLFYGFIQFGFGFVFNQYDNEVMHRMLYILSIMFFFEMLMGAIPTGFVTATGHARILSMYLVIFGISNVVIDYIFINAFGFMGIVYGTVLNRSICDIVLLTHYYLVLRKEAKAQIT